MIRHPGKPRWLRDLLRFAPLKSQLVLSGNVRDLQAREVAPGTWAAVPLLAVLAAELHALGYPQVLAYDAVTGFRLLAPSGAEGPADGLLGTLGVDPVPQPSSLERLLEVLQEPAGEPLVLVVDFASRLLLRSGLLQPAEHRLFSRAMVHAHRVTPRPCGTERRPLYPLVLWIVEKEGDLPDWLVVGNPRLRHIPVPRPDHRCRRAVAPSLLRGVPEARAASAEALLEAEDALVEQTEGLLLVDVHAIAQLARSEGVAVARIGDAVRRYKVGVTEDPWQQLDRARIHGARAFIASRVKGQEHAVTHMLDIIKRAVVGVGTARRSGRPRGVAFFAGPTGVGKTELAKTITSLLFGDESAYIRFDMSELSAEHADQRLLGAPPGYVGYDVGGELTNAIRERPFSVVLFDEIEKAHPRILDKFLQILDDGVLTSGRGDRVYFSEALIVFTSNLGIYTTGPGGERVAHVHPSDPYEQVRARVRGEIERHFKLTLHRPELLNRIGENIIVFDFVRLPVARQIFDQMIEALLVDLRARDVHITLAATAREALEALCLADLSNGGRGIRNQVEAHLINPLARALFEVDAGGGGRWEVREVLCGTVTTLVLA